jgi:hypothetical protein
MIKKRGDIPMTEEQNAHDEGNPENEEKQLKKIVHLDDVDFSKKCLRYWKKTFPI